MPDDPKVTRDTSGRSIREADRRQREEYERDEPEAPVSRESTAPLWGQVRSKGQTARTVVGLMAFTTVFALISTEIEGFADPKKASGGVRILIGGGVATILLLVIAEAGDAGAQLAEGLAVVTTVAAVLVKGGPVWNWANKAFGSKPTGGTTGTPTVNMQNATVPGQKGKGVIVPGGTA